MDFISIPAFIQIGPLALWGLAVAFTAGLATLGFRKAASIERKIDGLAEASSDVKAALEDQERELKRSGRLSLRWTIALFVAGGVVTFLVTLLLKPLYA